MSFDLETLVAAVERAGRVVRVVVAGHRGSVPREAGAAMLVWADVGERGGGQSGTIGGGALEFRAAAAAREMLAHGPARRLEQVALGPAVGQCCGGAVHLLYEVYDAARLPRPRHGLVLRPMDGSDPTREAAALRAGEASAGGAAGMPLAVRRLLAAVRAGAPVPAPGLVDGWMVEPVLRPDRVLWIWGAGHVGRAIAAVLSPLPGVAITWVDIAADRFPDPVPDAVAPLVARNPADLVVHASPGAEHLIVTCSHALDLELCHRLLGHGFAGCGLIGSATKWARFRRRLATLGHAPERISRIVCPIGDPALGKHPQAIAVGVGAAFLRRERQRAARERVS